MATFLLQNNYLEFIGETKQHISGTAIGTNFAPPYACIFINQVELQFSITQIHQPLVSFRYIDDSSFYLDLWTSPVRKNSR